ncbi:MAG: GntR family transcriptional regulator [Microbacterium sp.]|uniref:GntR family transcriptional regulator n=1 Tax=Microbacterium sp. TaxID=51671 RepID=UPI00271763FE|nr:GntR family transcriptional regulator [Microbacterium sp.]MDO8383026.1 GntR family transcriptional regulator [Microbacterium sp.]
MSDATQITVTPVRDRRPLSVQVYDRLVVALRTHGHAGDVIPPEIELAADLGVSRTVLREALRLLEEDGVIERADDPRRRRLALPSARPPAFNAPLEEMLHATSTLNLDVVRTEEVASTEWSRGLLQLPNTSERLLCRESLFFAAGEPVASALELVPLSDASIPVHLATSTDPHETLLSAVGPQFRSRCQPTLWRLSPGGSAGSRTGFRSVPRGHLTTLTTVLSRGGRPVFLAKYLIRLDLVALAVGRDPADADDLPDA